VSLADAMDRETLGAAWNRVRERLNQPAAERGLILGSGWGGVIEAFDVDEELSYLDIPGLGRTGVPGHAGRMLLGRASGIRTVIFQGRRHWYEGEGWTPIALPIYLMKRMGVRAVLLTNAAGGVSPSLRPGDFVVIRDQINAFGDNPLRGPHDPFWGERFPDQTAVYGAAGRERLRDALAACGRPPVEGVYLGAAGPAYETPAEIRMIRTMGADLVGMSTVPEAMLANAAGLDVAGLSCVTNFGAGIGSEPLSHDEVVALSNDVMPDMRRVIGTAWNLAAAKASL
jgi:purine-nucleoside phosphorylase